MSRVILITALALIITGTHATFTTVYALTDTSVGLTVGKKRVPGPETMAPRFEAATVPTMEVSESLTVFHWNGRDPFKPPTEVLPTDCAPSMPLCRFDFSQLKCVGVIQVGNGQYKGMIEDPDGRAHFIKPGMRIGGGTVTQVTRDGAIIRMHKSRQDVRLPLNYSEGGRL